MAKQLNIDLNVRANTQQAQEALNNLSKNLQSIQNIKNMPVIADESYKSAANAAKTLERNLQAAVNVDTGKLDLNKFSMSLKKSNTSISELAIKLSGAGATGQEAFLNLARSIALADNSALSLGTKLNGLMTTLKNTARWQISSSILHGFMGAIQGAYGYAQDLNESLNNIRIITKQNVDQMASFAKEANNAAKALSTTTTEYTNASLIYYQQGLSEEDVKARTDATIKMANVTRQSAQEVSSQMTAIWNNFAKGNENLEYYEDVVTKLGATTASSSKEILDGLQQFAAVSDTVDLSYEKASAALATVVAETRQSANTVGTAFKTLFARVEGLKLGETLDDGTDLNKYSKALAIVGVNIKDQSGQLKDMDTILDDIGAKWNTLNKDQQVALAQTVAGVRQYTQFVALMDNYDKVLKNEQTAKNSSGTIDEQAKTYAESWEAARDRVKAAAEEIYQSLLKDDAFIDILNGLEGVLGFVNNIIEGLGGVKGVLLLIGSIFMQYYAKEMPRVLETVSQNLMIITGQGEKIKQDMLDEVQASLALERSSAKNFNQQSSGYEMQAKYEITQKAVEMTQKLNAEIKTLSQSEIEEAKAKINQVTKEGEYLVQLGKEIDLLDKKNNILKENAVKNSSATFANSSKETKKQLKKAGLLIEEEGGYTEAPSLEGKTSKQAITDSEDLLYGEQQKLSNAKKQVKNAKQRKNYNEKKKDMAKEDLENQENIIKNSNNEEERVQAEKKIEEIKANIAAYDEKIQAATKTIESGEKNIEAVNAEIEKQKLTISALEENEAAVQKDIEERLSKSAGFAKILKSETTNIGARAERWKMAQEAIKNFSQGTVKQQEKSKKMTTDLAQQMTDYGNKVKKVATEAEAMAPKNAKKEFSELIKTVDLFNDEVKKASKSKDWSTVNEMLKENEGLWKSITNASNAAGKNLNDTIVELRNKYQMLPEDVQKLADALGDRYVEEEKFNEGLSQNAEEGSKRTKKMSEVFTELGSTIMQVSMAINAIQNIGNIWKNEDLTTGEKILQTMTAMGTLIPALVSSYKALTTIINKDTIATAKDTIAKGAQQVATFMATVAQEGLNAAMEANPIGAVIAAIVAFVAILAVLVTALMAAANAESEEEKALKKANEELEKAQEEAKAAKEAYENLYNKVSDYKTAYEALQKCTKGTKEWKEAFEEVSNKANELIEAYPDLLKYEHLFDANGLINPKELDKALKNYEDRVSATKITTIQKQANVTSAQYEVDKSNLSDKIKINNIDGQATGNIIIAAESAKLDEKISNGITSALLANKDQIDNYKDSKSVSAVIKDYLKENAEEYSLDDSKITELTNEFTKKTTSLGKDFTDLSAETKKTIIAMTNASKMIANEFFGKELDMSNSEKVLAYNEALEKHQEETRKKIEASEKKAQLGQSADTSQPAAFNGGVVIKDEYLQKAGQTYIDNNTDEEKKNWKFKNVRNDYWTGKLEYVYVDEQGAEKKLTADTIKEFMIQYEAQKDKDEIIAEGKENTKKDLSNEEKAMSQYLVNSNLDGATIKQAQALSKTSDPLEAYFGKGYTDDDIKKKLAIAWNRKDASEISDDEFETWKKGIASNLKDVQDMIAETPDFIKKAMGDDLVDSLSVEAFPKVTKMFSQAYIQSGQAGVDMLKGIVDSAGDESSKVMAAISDLDFSTMDINDANTALKNLGIQFQLSETQFYNLKNTLQDISTVTAETAKETYKTVSSILSKLKAEGDIIEDEDYQKLLALNPAIESFFTTLADGTHMLTGEVQDFKTAMQSASLNQLQQVQENYQDTALAYRKLSSNSSGGGSLNSIDDFEGSYQAERLSAQIQVMRDQGDIDRANNYEIQLKDALDAGDSGLTKLNEILENGNQSWIDYGISTEEATKKIEEAEKEAGELTEAMKEQQYQNEISNAGLEYETTENYADVLMELHEAEGLSKDAARELAIANQRVDRGLTSLNDHLDDWKTSLEKTNKTSAEYAETISGLRESFSDLLNIADGNELSLGWIEKWAKSADMTKILDGDTKALERFRESAFTEMTTNVFSDMKDSVEDLIESLDKVDDAAYLSDLQNLLNILNDGTFSAENLRNAIQDLGNQEIGSGATLSDEYVESLNSMLAAGLMTEQQLNDIFATIGYKPKVRTELVDQWVEIPTYETTEDITENTSTGFMSNIFGGTRKSTRTVVSKTVQTGTERMLQRIPVAQIESSDKEGGNIEIVNAGSNNITPSYSSTTTGSSSDSDSSSSSSSTPTTKAASHDHEVNRYSAEENAINGLSKQYEYLNDAKDKAFGKSKIQAIENEIKKLKELKQASSNYLDAIVGDGNGEKIAKALYKGESLGKLIQNGNIGGTLAFDYNALFSGPNASGKQVEYTAKDENGNEWLETKSYSLNDFNNMFGTNFSFDLDSFGHIQNKDSILNTIQEIMNSESDAYSSIADPSANSTNNYNERIALLELVKENIEQYEGSVEDALEQVDSNLNYITQLQEENAELLNEKMNQDINLSEKSIQKLNRALKVLGNDIYRSGESLAKAYKINEEKIDSEEEKAEKLMQEKADADRRYQLYLEDPFDEDAITPEAYGEFLENFESEMDTVIDNLQEYQNFYYDTYTSMLDYWDEKMSNIMSSMEHGLSTLDYYLNILDLMGESDDYDMIGTILKKQQKIAEDMLYSSQERVKTYESEYEAQKKILENMQKDPALSQNKDLIDEQLKIVQAAKEKLEDAESEFQENHKNTLDFIYKEFENEVERAFSEYEKFLSGEYGSFDNLNASMDRQKSLTDDYLTKTNQIYETNKMLRQINQDIDKTDSLIGKNKLKTFSEIIEAMQEREKLSKTDLEIAQAKYDILQAELALEDAQNAKSTVQLRRDSEGNYGYVYTADQEAIDNAQQNLEDKLNALYNLTKTAVEDFKDQMIQLEQETAEAEKEIMLNSLLSTEEKNERLAELHEYTLERQQQLNEQYGSAMIAFEDSAYATRLAAQGDYNTASLVALDQFDTSTLNLEETTADLRAEAWNDSFTSSMRDQDTYKAHYNALMSSLKIAMNNLDNERARIAMNTNTSNKEIKESTDKITTAMDELSYEMTSQDGLISNMNAVLSASNTLSSSFSTQYDRVDDLIGKYSDAADEANKLYNRTVNLINAQTAYNGVVQNGWTEVSWPTHGDYDSAGSSGSGSGSSSGSGGRFGGSSDDSGGDSNSSGGGSSSGGWVFQEYDYNDKYHWKVERQNNTGAIRLGSKTPHNWASGRCTVCHKTIQFVDPRFRQSWSMLQAYKTGGYTGTWPASGKTGLYTGSWNGPDAEENGKLAFLHQKELVLNADDTENVLSAVKLIRQISESIDLQAAAQSSYSVGAIQFPNSNQVLQQEVTIHAEFPNATNHNEIEEAFNSLVNRATQYANRN